MLKNETPRQQLLVVVGGGSHIAFSSDFCRRGMCIVVVGARETKLWSVIFCCRGGSHFCCQGYVIAVVKACVMRLYCIVSPVGTYSMLCLSVNSYMLYSIDFAYIYEMRYTVFSLWIHYTVFFLWNPLHCIFSMKCIILWFPFEIHYTVSSLWNPLHSVFPLKSTTLCFSFEIHYTVFSRWSHIGIT